ncbi:MAG: hypothetical protein K6T51_01325 [Rubrobacteraceae bacterium]|nr:hypothetical protein [Rubrobacteraceae bacterium]
MAAIGALLASLPVAGAAAALAALLAMLAPALSSDDAGFLAHLILKRPPKILRETQWGVQKRTYEQNLAYRAHYAAAAARRLASGESDRAREERFFAQHLAAEEARVKSARMAEAAADRWGPLLGWIHTNTAKTHRPSHIAADGANFDVRYPPVSTGGLPGTLPHCDCIAGPPTPGARMLR